MESKVVFISGGSSPIGQFIVKSFLRGNYIVAFSYRTSNKQNLEFINDISSNQNIYPYKMDVLDESQVEKTIKEIEQKFGRIDVLVCNSGLNIDNRLENMLLADWQLVVDTNLTGSFLLAKHCIPIMLKNVFGRMLFIGSVVGQNGGFGVSNYAASKAALSGLAKSVMREYSKFNITANVISLGYVDVGMTSKMPSKILEKIISTIPLRKLGEMSHIADFIVELASEKAAYITGETINISGGL